MTAAELERKVRQHENDISAIYTMIADVQNTQRRHTNRFDELGQDVESIGGRLSSLESKVNSLDGRVDTLNGAVDSLNGKVDQVLELLQR